MDNADAIGTYGNENPTCTSLHHPGRAMTAEWTGSGNTGGRPRGSRNRAILNEEFIAALLRHFRREGERAITRMAATQPAAYCKILTLLVPRELKLEHTNPIEALSNERLEAMIAELEERIAAKAAGLGAKVITHEDPPALPAPKRKRANLILEAADTAIAPTTARYRKARRDQDVG